MALQVGRENCIRLTRITDAVASITENSHLEPSLSERLSRQTYRFEYRFWPLSGHSSVAAELDGPVERH